MKQVGWERENARKKYFKSWTRLPSAGGPCRTKNTTGDATGPVAGRITQGRQGCVARVELLYAHTTLSNGAFPPRARRVSLR